MSQQTESLAILFADISGSTMLYETLGNRLARELVVRCLGMMTARLAAHHGTLIKTIGDELMCSFPSAETALRAACEMQDAVESGKPGGATPMYIRIGFNYGEVLREDDDVHGDVVNVAARITEVARARQILATHAAIEALPPELRHRARYIRRARIKGRQAALDLFQIGWLPEGGDRVRVGNPADRKPEGLEEQLVLRHRDQHITVSDLQYDGHSGPRRKLLDRDPGRSRFSLARNRRISAGQVLCLGPQPERNLRPFRRRRHGASRRREHDAARLRRHPPGAAIFRQFRGDHRVFGAPGPGPA